jgi:hypothetical protein
MNVYKKHKCHGRRAALIWDFDRHLWWTFYGYEEQEPFIIVSSSPKYMDSRCYHCGDWYSATSYNEPGFRDYGKHDISWDTILKTPELAIIRAVL